uniref:Uncharacterized protein n=1 Tax=viral metagenome TaxID=1070528 RepID=A0A6C0DLU9_9ZZZZ
MENSITRIADLPDTMTSQSNTSYSMNIPQNINNNPPISSGGQTDNGLPTNYIPINVHPNPYGISAQNPIMPIPQQTTGQQQQQPQQQQPQYQQMNYIGQPTQSQQFMSQEHQQQRLPSRDIPRDATGYIQDEQIQPNYIPKSTVKNDYVREYEDTTEKNMREYEQKKRHENRLDMIFTELQTPLLIAILFFIFQMPIINTMIFKKFSFLSIYTMDGNFNIYGLLFKSLLFASLFYSITKSMKFLSEF